ASAMTAAIALAGCGGGAEISQTTTEKGYGGAQARKNDCATEAHSFKGQAPATKSPRGFINLPLRTCQELAGAPFSERRPHNASTSRVQPRPITSTGRGTRRRGHGEYSVNASTRRFSRCADGG